MAKMNFPPFWLLAGVPLALLALLFGLFYGLQVDFWLADQWFALEGQHWALQHHWFVETVLHQGARSVNQLIVAGLLLYFLVRRYGQRLGLPVWLPAQQQAHGRLLLSLLLSLAGVALLKQLLPMQCPWDLQAFGGRQTFTPLFSLWPADQAKIACFPAGHASVGFAWLALYFFCKQLYPALARPALCFAVMLGLVLGQAQQLRGAHFFSHDIASAAWCWSMACLVAYYAGRTNTVTDGPADGCGQAQLAVTCCSSQPQHIARRLL